MKLSEYISQWSSFIGEYLHEIKLIAYVIFVGLNINIDVVKLLSYLMVIDSVLGVAKTIRIPKLRFTFRKLLWGLVSKALLLLIPIILAVSSLALGYDFKWLVDVVLKILIVSETISSITNILSVREKKEIKNTDYISVMLHAIRKFFTSKIDKFLKDINK